MFAAHLMTTPDEPQAYCVVVRRNGDIVRRRPVGTIGEGNRLLSQLLREERAYEADLRRALVELSEAIPEDDLPELRRTLEMDGEPGAEMWI